jgi:hypothetical protein
MESVRHAKKCSNHIVAVRRRRLAAGCGAGHSPAAIPHGAGLSAHRKELTLPKYVIVMVLENRTVDNLFQTQPGVETRFTPAGRSF